MRRLLFFTGQRMFVYHWVQGAYQHAEYFEADSEGLHAFERYLRNQPRQSLRILVDIVEEVFRVETMPHVFGRDRQALIGRLLTRHFRNTEFRRLIKQGRLSSGRRDDVVLISALTNPELLKKWLAIIQRCQAPLESISSLPLLAEKLLPYLSAHKGISLLVSQQSPGLVRQSFYRAGQLKLSRLIPVRYENAETFSSFLLRELANTLRFLESQRLIRHTENLEVHVLAAEEQCEALQHELRNDDLVNFHVHAYSVLAARLGMKGELPSHYADGLFGCLLLKQKWPRNDYATAVERNHYYHRSIGFGLHLASGLLMLAAVVLSGAKFIEAGLYDSYRSSAEVETHQYQRLYDKLLQQMGQFPLQAAYIKNAVDLVDRLDANLAHSPEYLMAYVGYVLDRHAPVRITNLQWIIDTHADAVPGNNLRTNAINAKQLLNADKRYEIALLQGNVQTQANNYRQALEQFDSFIAELRASGRFEHVEVRRTPFDMNPDAAISGHTGTAVVKNNREEAAFEILLRLSGAHGAV